jgi:hypothetical protein
MTAPSTNQSAKATPKWTQRTAMLDEEFCSRSRDVDHDHNDDDDDDDDKRGEPLAE